jgi:hypothetical protein
MKTKITVIALLVAPTLALAQDDNATGSSGHDANAQPKLHTVEIEGASGGSNEAGLHDHGIGLGFSETPSGLKGVDLEAPLGGPLVLDLTAGFDLFSPKNGSTVTALGVGGALFYRMKVWSDVAFMIGGRVELEHVSSSSSSSMYTEGNASATQVNVEFPLRAEIYFAGKLALHAEVAAVLALVTDSGGGALGSQAVAKGTYFAVPLTNLVSDFGVVYFFE